MMKKIALFAFLLASLNIHAQKQQWKQFHDFRFLLDRTYELTANNKLQPAKDSASGLVEKAKELQASPIPASYDSRALKSLLKKLVKDTESLQSGVRKSKSDADIKTMMTQVNETFQQISAKCNDQLW
ncbi:MAG: hypothetical protein ABW007_05360 [Chitinophagaceae bacterium]